MREEFTCIGSLSRPSAKMTVEGSFIVFYSCLNRGITSAVDLFGLGLSTSETE
ncbi:hypothetical protein CIP107570_00103 [Corynebacterium diphtheriae]|nr:hypothetical protein CIP107570_00103 [Corynebacterium diphtheriae]CAB0672687.1 hypothetical protein FRC0038_00044 [Corynebacterium diphtheriae]CAB0799678.1 hypothetical protein FRC0268_00233 [Corynebacterium diphtheriae]